MSHNDDFAPALKRKRRSWTMDEKRRIVDESLADGASIAEVARRHDLNTNQLFTWRRQFGVELATSQEFASILPVTITPDATAEYSAPGSTGQMEIMLADGDRIIVWADVETAALSRVVKALQRGLALIIGSGSARRKKEGRLKATFSTPLSPSPGIIEGDLTGRRQQEPDQCLMPRATSAGVLLMKHEE